MKNYYVEVNATCSHNRGFETLEEAKAYCYDLIGLNFRFSDLRIVEEDLSEEVSDYCDATESDHNLECSIERGTQW
jgi:hypothetical protein